MKENLGNFAVSTLRWSGLKSKAIKAGYLSPSLHLAVEWIEIGYIPAFGWEMARLHLAVEWIEILPGSQYQCTESVSTLRWSGLKYHVFVPGALTDQSPPCGGVD